MVRTEVCRWGHVRHLRRDDRKVYMYEQRREFRQPQKEKQKGMKKWQSDEKSTVRDKNRTKDNNKGVAKRQSPSQPRHNIKGQKRKAIETTWSWPECSLTFGCCGLEGKRCNCGGRSGM